MDITFQVPMQYCSLQRHILLLSPVTSTTGYCFCFGSMPSFFLELFLHWSPVAYWALTNLGCSSFSLLSFLPFHTVHGVLKARILKWFASPFSHGPHSLRPLHHDLLSVLGGPIFPGSSPSGSRVIQRGDRVSVRGKNLFNYRYKERLEKNSVVGKLVEKRVWITWFTWKTNKIPRQGIFTIYVGHQSPLE